MATRDCIATCSDITPVHLQPFSRQAFGYREGDFLIVEAAARSPLALPFHWKMTEWQVEHVCQRLAAVKKC